MFNFKKPVKPKLGIAGKMVSATSGTKEVPKGKLSFNDKKGSLGKVVKSSKPSQGVNESMPTSQGFSTCPTCGNPTGHEDDED